MTSKKIYSLFALVLVATVAGAQNHRIDFSIRASGSKMTAENIDSDIYGFRVQANYLLSKNFSLGLAYSRSDFFNNDAILSSGEIQSDKMDEVVIFGNEILRDGDAGQLSVTPKLQSVGLAFQFGTDRNNRLRFYGTFECFFAEIVNEIAPADSETAEQIVVGNSGIGVGAGMGLSLKLGRVVSFNIFEVKANYYGSSFNYFADDPLYQFQVESGFSIKLFRKK